MVPTACGWPARHARPEVASRCQRSLRAEAPRPRYGRPGRCETPLRGYGEEELVDESQPCQDPSDASVTCFSNVLGLPVRPRVRHVGHLSFGPVAGGKTRA